MQKKIDAQTDYQYGFHDKRQVVYQTKPGLSERTVKEISSIKSEPEWMRKFRLDALNVFQAKPMPTWGADLSAIDFEKIIYYIKPSDRMAASWDDVPADIKKTFDRIGVPEAERKFFAGAAAQYDSDVIYHALRKNLLRKGVIFVDMDTAVREYPDLVKQYFGKIIPVGDNKFAALNSAAWSGGSFIYVPPGVKVEMPLQAYFRINSQNFGQFERTLIIADEGSEVQYLEGCFRKGALITVSDGYRKIEEIRAGDKALTHKGRYKKVYHVQSRSYSGNLYTIAVYGDPSLTTDVTEEHPFLCVPRILKNERNKMWKSQWSAPRELKEKDYLAVPINKTVQARKSRTFEVEIARRENKWLVPHKTRIKTREKIIITCSKDLFTLIGYYLAEGSISNGYYLNFSFGTHEIDKVAEVEWLLARVFGVKKSLRVFHKKNHGVSVVVCSVKLVQVFRQFGTSAAKKQIPPWAMFESPQKQAGLIRGYFNGDGNYYKQQNKHSFKEIFRMNTVSPVLARQVRDMLLRLNIVAFIHARDRKKEQRQIMYTVGIGGEFMVPFGKIVGIAVKPLVHQHKRATVFGLTDTHAFFPIKSIKKKSVKNLAVYNFSVDKDESYVANSVAVHNCTAPVYATDSLHAAVVEIVARPHSRVRYMTVQNWSHNVYNLVTKRARAQEGAFVEWVDCNLGCLTENAKVFVNPRGPTSIKDLKSGDVVYTIDLNSFGMVKQKVKALVYQGNRQTFRLVTTNHRDVEATENHPFLVMRSSAFSGSRVLAWEPLKNLKIGDWIGIANELPDDGVPFHIDFVHDEAGLKQKPVLPQTTTKELMWLLGLYLGDGYIERSKKGRPNRVYFAVPPQDRARNKLEAALEDSLHIKYRPKGICVTVGSSLFAEFLIHLGFAGTARTKKIPSWLFSLPREQKLAFIEGYLDADGYTRKSKIVDGTQYGQIVFASCNKKLLESLKLLMISVGLEPLKISSYVKERMLYKDILKEYTTHYLSLNVRENLDKIKGKGNGAHSRKVPLKFVRIASIESIGFKDVYDIEIDGTPNFIANGILVHNSKVTMKYPSVFLTGRGASADTLSIAMAGPGQHQDAGAKMVHIAPDTRSNVISKSVSFGGGRTSYRGLTQAVRGATNARLTVRCDALILDPQSRSDTYPTMRIDEEQTRVEHEARVSRIGEKELFYLRSRGLSEVEASSLIVTGFFEPLIKYLPVDYAVEMNRLIQLEMEDAVG